MTVTSNVNADASQIFDKVVMPSLLGLIPVCQSLHKGKTGLLAGFCL